MAMSTETTTMETTVSITLTAARSTETCQRLVLIARLSDDMGNSILSLQQLQHFGYHAIPPALSVASRLVGTLSSIRANLERIRGYMMNDEAIVSGQFNDNLDVCTRVGRELQDKLNPIATASAPAAPQHIRLGNVTVVSGGTGQDSDSDWESVKGSRRSDDERSATSQQHVGKTLGYFQPFGDHLLTGLEVLLTATGCTSSSDQDILFAKVITQEIFNQIRQDQRDLVANSNHSRSSSRAAGARLKLGLSSLGSRLLPSTSKFTTLLRTAQPHGALESPKRRNSLPRANTWPLRKHLDKTGHDKAHISPAKEARKARQRSQLIDKQIEADLHRRNKEAFILTAGPRGAMELLMNQLISKSTGFTSHTPATIKEAARSSPACIHIIKQTVLSEMKHMLADVVRHRTLESYESYPEGFWTGEELSFLEELRSKMNDEQSTLDQFIVPFERLLAWDKFRDACRLVAHHVGRLEAHDRFIMESARRMSTPNYVPTLTDYQHFYQHRQPCNLRGKFHFDALSVNWVDCSSLYGCWDLKLPKRTRHFFDDCTTYIQFYDLATYHFTVWEGAANAIENQLAEFECRAALQSSYSPHMSVVVVFSNLVLYREKLAQNPLPRRWFVDYQGENGNEGQTVEFLIGKFRNACSKRKLYVHVGEPEDPKTTEFILQAIKDTKLNSALSEAGVIKMGKD